ncbi:unnamed protein product [Darwinula stevensoni]|uniref:Heat shock protein 90 n=1 Tax=Darwinula stevensoni TaxID=69355 RepID=A0A7R9AIU8_9CRUS|nr:unnamed protein product [Darwinula stevensoni]CAG0906667.1 unnamed protein product [Darwinula stevensoni]
MQYLSHYKLKELVNKYSDHISLPIQMRKEEWVEGKDGKGGEMVRTDTWETVNHANALWTRPKKDITPEQYQDFYKQISYDHHDALAYTHNRVEGSTEYTQLLYIPAQAPFDLYNRNDKTGLKLYVKRVFIMEDAETLLPGYLRFIKGIVDANDLPLNVSRELLQESRDVRNIREGNTRRVLGLLEDLAKSDTATPTQEGDGSSAKDDKYATFYQAFGAVLKEGLAEDMSNQARIAELLRYRSSLSEGQNISLAQYVARMKEGQKAIYYLTADSELAAQNSPQLEVFKKKGIEVLFMTDRVDEWAMGYLNEYQGKPLQSVAKGAADLGDLQDEAEKKAVEEASNTYKPLLEKLKTALQEQVQDVRISNRLVDSPACLVVQDHGMSMQLERLLKQTGQKIPSSKPTMEINPHNALIQNLSTSSSSDFDALAHVLYDQALLAEGLMPSDPATFVKRINSLLLSAQSSALSSAQSPAAEKAS